MATQYEIPPKRRARWRVKSRRPKFIVLGVLVGVVMGWHFVPVWRKHVLESAFAELQAYRSAHGRYPNSQAELDEALHQGSLARRGCSVHYELGHHWHSMAVFYCPSKDGRGFSLDFNHYCFCDFPDISRYSRWGDSGKETSTWDEWCD